MSLRASPGAPLSSVLRLVAWIKCNLDALCSHRGKRDKGFPHGIGGMLYLENDYYPLPTKNETIKNHRKTKLRISKRTARQHIAYLFSLASRLQE